MSDRRDKIIPAKYIPDVGSHIESIGGEEYLIANDAMYTFYRRTRGEFSPFFLALRDRKKIAWDASAQNADWSESHLF